MSDNLTLKQTNERIDLLEEKIEQILNVIKSNNKNSQRIETYWLNINNLESNCTNADNFLNLVKAKSKEFTDKHDNVYVQLPTIWIIFKDETLEFIFDKNELAFIEPDTYEELKPQAISKYKNSLVDGKIRSIPNHAPDFTQFSFNKSTKFCNWVDGEQLNWETVLYIQIMWAYAYQTKKNNEFLPNETWKWDNARDCGFNDTGKGIGEFLGIEQLFTSGRNFVSFDNRKKFSDLWNLYVSWNYNSDFDACNKYGLWGDYDRNAASKSAFFSGWGDEFNLAWDDGYYGVRLCKTILKGC